MDSPIDPGSPTSISSDDAPQDDVMILNEGPMHGSHELTQAFAQRDFPSSSNGKRRQPPGGFSSSYMAKSRRREEGPSRRTTATNSQWLGGGDAREGAARSQKDELVDTNIVERIRNDWGDPFDDAFVKGSS